MSVLAGALAIVKRDALIYVSYRFRFVSQIAAPIFSLTLFYYVSRLVRADALGSQDEYYAFVAVGILILGVLISTLVIPPVSLRQELVAGTFERMVLSPFGAIRCTAAMMIFPVFVALGVSTVAICFVVLVFGLDVQWPGALLGIPLALLGALAFLPFGLLMAAIVLTLKQAAGGASMLVAGISLVAGLYFPVTLLPDSVQWMSVVQPFTPALELMRHAIVGTPLTSPVWLDLLKLIGFAGFMLPLSFWVLRAALDRSRRRGTVIEY